MCRCEQTLQKPTLFFIVFVSTIFVIRLFVFLVPEANITFLGLVIHHFWFGVALLLGAIFLPENHSLRIFLYGVGGGLLVDQLFFMLIGAGNDKEYWSLPSFLGAVLLTGLIFFIKERVIQFSLYRWLNRGN